MLAAERYKSVWNMFLQALTNIPKKYVNINGKVSKDKWQSMFRYFAKYV